MTNHFPCKNRLLIGLDELDLALIVPRLIFVHLPTGLRLETANKSIEGVYFFETGFASVLATTKLSRRPADVGLVGLEGMTGLSVIGGSSQSPLDTVMRVSGTANSIDAHQLRQLLARSATMLAHFTLYGLAFRAQTEQASLANVRASIEQRLARYLLMAQDRLNADALEITHNTMSLMLGVRRPAITIALHQMGQKCAIKASRGVVQIINRALTISLAGEFYGAAEREYDRLFGKIS